MATVMFEHGSNGVDLSRLNEAERQVLNLLAEGHTAKSIANELDCTPAAVNERLREARRKTGVGSSRELARVLKSQEIRHNEIGIGSEFTLSNQQSFDAKRWRSRTGVAAMIALTVAVVAALAMSVQSPSTSSEPDPLIGGPVERFSQPADQHAKVRTEKRDPEWAPRIEAAVRARLLQIPLVGKQGNELRLTCGSTTCEFAGTLVGPAQAPGEYDPNLPLNKAVADLQSKPLNDDLDKLGLKPEGGSFLSGKGKPDRGVFLLYYSRK